MQNRYCCDQGDFGKYGLLRCLCNPNAHGESLRLGMMWYLVPDETGNLDGKHTSYLDDKNKKNLREYRACDPELWDNLRRLLDDKRRNIRAIQGSEILPAETVYFEELLKWPDDMRANTPAGRDARLEHRKQWWQRGFDLTRDCQVVFFDPDNGLKIESVPLHGGKGPKFTSIDEVVPFYDRGQSIIVYQHLDHSMKADLQIRRRLKQLRKATGADKAFAMRYHRGTARVYLVVPNEKHAAILLSRAREMCKGPWARHFDMTELS
ncbi:hypothetical protein J7M28_00960 [bacterium]|nr:hypothetical protein [bacterium]